MRLLVLGLVVGVAVVACGTLPNVPIPPDSPVLQPSPPPAAKPPVASPSAPKGMITYIQAKPGESCAGYTQGCHEWCGKNMAGDQGCLGYCKEQTESCLLKGEWSMDNGTRIVIGMPPQ